MRHILNNSTVGSTRADCGLCYRLGGHVLRPGEKCIHGVYTADKPILMRMRSLCVKLYTDTTVIRGIQEEINETNT